MGQRPDWRICSELRRWSTFAQRRGKHGNKLSPPVHDDPCAADEDEGRVRHKFNAAGPNEPKLVDITEPWTGKPADCGE